MENKLTRHHFRSIKKTFEFESIYQNGKKIKLAQWFLIIVTNNTPINKSEENQKPSNVIETFYGVTASRKVGKAVLRNKLKRWVRNSAKEGIWPKKLYGKKTVFIFRPQPKGYYDKIRFADFKLALENLRYLR